MFTKKQQQKTPLNEERGRLDGVGWRRRNRTGTPEEKVIWNHFRLSEDMGKVFSHTNGYAQYRRGFVSVTESKNNTRRGARFDRHEAKP